MKRLLYPLIASALITIVPFLLTFEKGQDIVRGLFGYEYFVLLLLIIFVKEKILSWRGDIKTPKRSKPRIITYTALLAILIATLFAIAWIDLQNILAIKGADTGWYEMLPFLTCGLAIAIIWKIPAFNLTSISFILFITLMVHFATYNYYPMQPLAQFPLIDYLARTAPQPIQRKDLSEEYRSKYAISDSASITRNFIDTNRANVAILVESWGVPLDIKRFEKQLENFDKLITAAGIHHRMYSRTRTAEREDLIYEIHLDSSGRRDTTFLPKVLAEKNFKTAFFSGGDSLEHRRFKYIYNLGFQDVYFANSAPDVKIINHIDSLLSNSTLQFIAWTTRDTKFQIKETQSIYQTETNTVDSIYSYRLKSTLQQIANLAKKHPNVRFIIQGDHDPILSPIPFQERFYKRWVPYIILN